MTNVDVRCPVGPQKLFTKLKLGEEFATHIPQGNLIEVSCSDCRSRMRREGDGDITHVLHRFNFLGELIESVVRRRGDAAESG